MSELAQAQEAESKTTFGFWIYLMTDCVLFASLFATYAVLRNATAGGPGSHELFSLPFVLVETLILLISSTTIGLAMMATRRGDKKQTLMFLAITLLLGVSFLAMELSEFRNLLLEGNSWTSSAFLSAFFTLVGTHGLHIAAGLLWMLVLLVKVANNGFSASDIRRLSLLVMFWHFLDVIWIFIFSVVYLLGAV